MDGEDRIFNAIVDMGADENHAAVPGLDSDGDGTIDDEDGCPNDSNKIDPGGCGCGVVDTDSDNDGTPDCNQSELPPENDQPDVVEAIKKSSGGGGSCFISTIRD